ncbi:MAG: hypothetical protein M1831_000745 [Alyxoria varia]|nr:MAG: hypothetical protein M1831_000745 [Alyxoria varia]
MAVLSTLVETTHASIPYVFGVAVGMLALWHAVNIFKNPIHRAINYSFTDITYAQAKIRCCTGLFKLLESGFVKSAGRPFYVFLCSGPTLILPHTTAIEMDKKSSAFSLEDALNREFHTHRFPELAPYKQPNDHKNAFARRIKQGLDDMMLKLADEVPGTLHELWGEKTTWQRRELAADSLHIISRLSGRVFVSEDLCRDETWLRLALSMAHTFVRASVHLQLVPSYLRPAARYMLPSCRELKTSTNKARKVLEPIIERRRELKKGNSDSQPNDAIEWFEEIGHDKGYDPVPPQLQLVLASVATTGDFFIQVMNNLCTYPEFIAPLREEAEQVVKDNGGSLPTAALKELHLMDSFLKESIRMKPTSPIIMERKATSDVILADGTHIPKETYTAVSQMHLWDDDVFPNARTFDPRRFLNKTQFVTQSSSDFVFGYGLRSCAGRFFASYEIKLALVHMLLKYDFELAEGSPVPSAFGVPLGDYIMADERAMMNVRRREGGASLLV